MVVAKRQPTPLSQRVRAASCVMKDKELAKPQNRPAPAPAWAPAPRRRRSAARVSDTPLEAIRPLPCLRIWGVLEIRNSRSYRKTPKLLGVWRNEAIRPLPCSKTWASHRFTRSYRIACSYRFTMVSTERRQNSRHPSRSEVGQPLFPPCPGAQVHASLLLRRHNC